MKITGKGDIAKELILQINKQFKLGTVVSEPADLRVSKSIQFKNMIRQSQRMLMTN